MTWRTAYALVTVRAEVDAYAPQRSKTYDGTIGDAAHAARPSAHNPNDAGVVCGWDVTHSPATGFDAHKWARRQTTAPPPGLCYIISNGQVARWSNNWQWVKYKGANEHKTHAHVVVGRGSDSEPTNAKLYDDRTPWRVAKLMTEENDMPIAQFSAAVKAEMEAAQHELKLAGLLSSEDHPIGDAAPVGYSDMMMNRLRKHIDRRFDELTAAIKSGKVGKGT